MADSTRKEQIKQHIKEAKNAWDSLTKRIEAIQKELGRTLDEERKVVLQDQLADLEKERAEIEAELEGMGD